MSYTVEQKIEELKREIAMRRRVYPGWIEKGRLDAEAGIRQIGILRAILEDYEAQLGRDRVEPELLRRMADSAKD